MKKYIFEQHEFQCVALYASMKQRFQYKFNYVSGRSLDAVLVCSDEICVDWKVLLSYFYPTVRCLQLPKRAICQVLQCLHNVISDIWKNAGLMTESCRTLYRECIDRMVDLGACKFSTPLADSIRGCVFLCFLTNIARTWIRTISITNSTMCECLDRKLGAQTTDHRFDRVLQRMA